ncbi:ExeA family protein [Pelovirga terrestris]|uniref:AAA family ATPase n=1 Tax=Pelovirga terrestris TaxID=2771352 RepID=A0A8J6ULM7_9BACT|nr:AAA family ATPase [Pelovirga terrestris]MBD1401417.1 AAA family ATPase [Pelovirga terrestris]
MYESFYGLQEKPFSLTPDPGFFYRYAGHQEALNVLLIALQNGEGFIQVTGEVGTGKTLLCRRLLQLLQDTCATAYLPNPLLSPAELYRAIAEDLQLELPSATTLQQLVQLIFRELARLKQQQRPLVILIDEAQAMSHRSLEALRLLSNLETEKEKLLHIVLFAQPELKDRLAANELRQLRQRITFTCELAPMGAAEVGAYIHHRLTVAGLNGENFFTPAAVKCLARASRGVPRLVNLLAHKALLASYGKGARRVARCHAQAAVRDSDAALTFPRRVVAPYLLESGLIVLFGVVLLFAWSVLR